MLGGVEYGIRVLQEGLGQHRIPFDLPSEVGLTVIPFPEYMENRLRRSRRLLDDRPVRLDEQVKEFVSSFFSNCFTPVSLVVFVVRAFSLV